MPFWSDNTASAKLSFRWFATFGFVPPGNDALYAPNGAYQINTYCLRSFQKPSVEISQSEYIWLNDVAYRPGLLTWNPIEIIITDMENYDDTNTTTLYEILKRAGYGNRGPNAPRAAITKADSLAALGGDLVLTQLNADGESVELWRLINPFIVQANFGSSNYGAEEINSISLSIRYDYAEYELENF